MTVASLKLAAAVAAGLGALAIAGCGGEDELPDDAVAKVGDTVITRDDYDKWHGFIALSPFLKDAGDAELKRETMQTLIESEWVEQEAAARGISVPDELVERQLEAQKEDGFPNDNAYRQFLEDAGLTEDDLRYRIKITQLRETIEQAIARKESKVSDEDIEEYYEGNRQRLSEPERRDFTFVLTRRRAQAERARQALEGGAAWPAVLKRYSIDPENSEAQAVRGPKLAEGRESLERAVYRAKKGEINGPVETRFGWYVFEVTMVTPAYRQSLDDAEEMITTILRDRRETAALEGFRRDYRADTVCAEEFKAPECSNGPKKNPRSES